MQELKVKYSQKSRNKPHIPTLLEAPPSDIANDDGASYGHTMKDLQNSLDRLRSLSEQVSLLEERMELCKSLTLHHIAHHEAVHNISLLGACTLFIGIVQVFIHKQN